MCLILAFVNNYVENDIPVNVNVEVRFTQYLGILICLLMEEGELLPRGHMCLATHAARY